MSSNTPHRTQTIGFKEEAIFNTDPIVNGSEEFYEFGIYTQSWGKFPVLESDIVQYYKGTSYDPYNTHISSTRVIGNLLLIPVNMIMLYYLFARKESSSGTEDGGIVDDAGSPPEFTITPISDGEVQSFTCRFKTSNETDTIEKSITGCRLNSMTLSLDMSAQRIPLGMSLNFQGVLMSPTQSDTDDATLVLPDSINTPYYFDGSNTLFTWDGVNLKDYLMGFAYTGNTFNRFGRIVNQHFPNWVITGSRTHGITFTLRRTDETSVFADYMAQAGQNSLSADVFKTLVFKIFKDNGTDYLQITFTNVAIQSIVMNDADADRQEVPTYEITALVESVVVVEQSGLTTQTFMGIGT